MARPQATDICGTYSGVIRMLFEDQLGNFLFIVFWSVILLVAVYWVVRRAIRDESSQRTKND